MASRSPHDAPGTYKALKAHLDAGKRLVVYDGGCEGTIYADPAVNHAFRAWHDFSHWKGGHDFSVEGECAVFERQKEDLLSICGDTAETRRWIRIPVVASEWDEPSFAYEAEVPRSAWQLFNAATFALKRRVTDYDTPKLHKIIDGVCEPVN